MVVKSNILYLNAHNSDKAYHSSKYFKQFFTSPEVTLN